MESNAVKLWYLNNINSKHVYIVICCSLTVYNYSYICKNFKFSFPAWFMPTHVYIVVCGI